MLKIKLNVQHNLSVLNADLSIAKSNVTVYGAIYDVNNGLINFLSGTDLALPAPDRVQPMGWGTFKTQDSTSGYQTSVTRTVSFTKAYSTPPRIFPGIFGMELQYGGGRPNFSSTFQNITQTGFDITVSTTGDCQFKESAFNWVEIPDELAYAAFQTGIWSTKLSIPTDVTNQCLFYQVTFPVPYASVPNVSAVPLGFDIEHPNVTTSVEVSSTQITMTGFLITIKMTPGQQIRAGSVSWLAYPKDNTLGISAGPVGNTVVINPGWNTQGTAQLVAPIPSGQPTLVLPRIYKFSINPGDHLSMFSIADEPRTTKGFNYTFGKWNGYLNTLDASYIAWDPAAGALQ